MTRVLTDEESRDVDMAIDQIACRHVTRLQCVPFQVYRTQFLFTRQEMSLNINISTKNVFKFLPHTRFCFQIHQNCSKTRMTSHCLHPFPSFVYFRFLVRHMWFIFTRGIYLHALLFLAQFSCAATKLLFKSEKYSRVSVNIKNYYLYNMITPR